MSTYSFEATVNPGRFRRQKVAVSERIEAVKKHYAEIRRQQEADALSKMLNRAYIQELICKIKAALGYEIKEAELPKWPDPDIHYTLPAVLSREFVEHATRYWQPDMTLAQLDRELYSVDEYWHFDCWIKGRSTAVDTIEHDGPWYDVQTKPNQIFPQHEAKEYFFDPHRVDTSSFSWKDWRLKTLNELLAEALEAAKAAPNPHAVASEKLGIWTEDMSCGGVSRRAVITGSDMQAMADKNQGYVHGHMWWNVPGKLLDKLFKRRRK